MLGDFVVTAKESNIHISEGTTADFAYLKVAACKRDFAPAEPLGMSSSLILLMGKRRWANTRKSSVPIRSWGLTTARLKLAIIT